MTVKVIDLINLYIGYNTSQQVNERLSTKFSYSMHKNMPKLQKDAEYWDSLTPEKRAEIREMEVEVNLVKVQMSELPEFFPSFQGRSAFQVFAPIIADLPEESEEEVTSSISALLSDKKENEPAEKKSPKSKTKAVKALEPVASEEVKDAD